MAGSALKPARSRTATALVFVIVAALLWLAPPTAAADSDCQRSDGWGLVVGDWLDVDPPDGQYPGGPITFTGNGTGIDNVVFYFGGSILGATGSINGDYSFSATVPDLPSGDYDIVSDRTEGGLNTICRTGYTVLALIAIIPDPLTGATIPLDTIDTTAPTTTTTTTTIATTTTTTTPLPTTPAPTTETPTTAATETPAATAAPTESTTVAPATSAPTTVAATTVAAETSTTLLEPTSTVSDTTLVAAAPQPDDDSSSSDGMFIGLLIGLGAAALVVSAWALGRRGRTALDYYHPPPPPPG